MFALDATGPVRWYLSFNAYDEVHGEPGGLTHSDGPNAVNYGENRNATSRFFDRMRISRYAIYLINEWDISDRTLFTSAVQTPEERRNICLTTSTESV